MDIPTTTEARPIRERGRGVRQLLDAAARDPAGEALLQLVDAALAGVIFFAPLIMAGRHAWGRAILVATIAIAAILWSFHQARRRSGGWTRSGAEWLLIAGAALLVVQLLPLPIHLLHSLSPHLPDALPLWVAADGAPGPLGHWDQVSLHPEATRGGLVMYLAYSLLFLVVVQRVQSLDDVERLVRWIAIAAVGMAVLALFQLLTGKNDFPWIQENAPPTPRGTVKGTFGEPGHLAHFLALGVGPLLCWSCQMLPPAGDRRSRVRQMTVVDTQQRQLTRLLLCGALLAVALAGLLTFSRGGVVVMLLAAFVCSGVYWYHRLSRNRAVWGMLGLICLSFAALWLYSYDALAGEWAGELDGRSQAAEQLEPSEARRKLWQAAMRAVADYPLLGTGAGTHRDVYPTYLSEYTRFEFRHAENGYLQVFQETGLVGFLLLIVGVGYLARWCGRLVRRVEQRRAVALAGAITAGLTVCVLHGLVDFVWYVPACLSVAVILAGCGCRLLQLAGRRSPVEATPLPRSAWIAMVFVLLAVSLAMFQNRMPSALAAQEWDRYLALAEAVDTADSQSPLDQASESRSSIGPLTQPALTAASNQRMRLHLQRVLQVDRRNGRAHLRLARTCLRLFESEQQGTGQQGTGEGGTTGGPTLHEIRDAALAARFPSRADFDKWLARSVGPHRSLLWEALEHTRRGLQLCPLQGEGYVYLSELAFLETSSEDAKFAYLDQAVRVRPHRHDVLLAVGREAASSGDMDRAIRSWRTVFQQGGAPRQMLLNTLADQLPAQFVVEQFEPDLAALRRLYTRYRDTGQDMQARFVAAPLVHALATQASRISGPEAAGLWYELHGIHRFLGDGRRALEAARRAVANSPDDYLLHRTLADRLFDNQLDDEARQQLQWCLRRRPDDVHVQQKLLQVNQHVQQTL